MKITGACFTANCWRASTPKTETRWQWIVIPCVIWGITGRPGHTGGAGRQNLYPYGDSEGQMGSIRGNDGSFVSEDTPEETGRAFVFLKFGEERRLHSQWEASAPGLACSRQMGENEPVNRYLGGSQKASLKTLWKEAFVDRDADITYLLLQLKKQSDPAGGGILLLLAFSAPLFYIVYSVYPYRSACLNMAYSDPSAWETPESSELFSQSWPLSCCWAGFQASFWAIWR